MTIDMERQIQAYAEFLDSTLPVLEAEEAMVERIGIPPVRPLQDWAVKPAVPAWVRAVVAAVVTIIVGVVVIVLLRATDQQADVIEPAPTTGPIPTTTAPPTAVPVQPTTPIEPPSGIVPATLIPTGFPPASVVIEAAITEPFSVASPVGTWTWTPIDVWNAQPPLPEALIDGVYLTERNTASPDGLDLSYLFGPTAEHHLVTDGETLYAFTDRLPLGPSLWRYDSGSWVEIPLPDGIHPVIDGVKVFPSFDVHVIGSTLILLPFPELEAWEFDLLGANDVSPLAQHPLYAGINLGDLVYNPAIDRIEIGHHDDGAPIVATITVEIVGETIEFRDELTGELLHTVNDNVLHLTTEELREAILTRDLLTLVSIPADAIFVSTDGGPFEQSTLADMGVDRFGLDRLNVDLNDVLLALTESGELRRSSDGLTWEKVETNLPAVPVFAGLSGGGDRVFLITDELVWTTTDGEAWKPVDIPGDHIELRIALAPFGWFATDGGFWSPSAHVYVSPDGINWQELEAPTDLCRAELAGETIFAYTCLDIDFYTATRWVATVETG